MEEMSKKAFWGGVVVREEGNMVLTLPRNSWDMNYHLYDTHEDMEYLIDISDLPDATVPLLELKDLSFKKVTM